MNASTQSNLCPRTLLGKCSVGLQIVFVGGIGISMVLVHGLGLLSYGDRWWDITVPMLFSSSIMAGVLGIRAMKTNGEESLLVRASVGVSILTLFFILLHSLFISD